MSQSIDNSIVNSISPTTRNLDLPGNTQTTKFASLPESSLRLDGPSSQQLDGPKDHAPSNIRGQPKQNEAPDYLNWGFPHEGPQPNGNRNTTGSASSPQLQTTFKNGTSTPPGRRSVQFARLDTNLEPAGSVAQELQEDGETPAKDRRGQSLMSKLKSLASTGTLQTHGRSQSGTGTNIDAGTISTPMSPADRTSRLPHTLLEEEGSDADAEETADEDTGTETAVRAKRKRRFRRHQVNTNASHTAPNTPKWRGPIDSPSGYGRGASFLHRRATDGSLEQRGHLSEGEGRDRLNHGAWRRGSSWISGSRGLSLGGHEQDLETPQSARRPGPFRRALTGAGGGQSEGEQTTRRPFLGAERATTFGAQRWRMLKHGLKLLGTRKEEHKIDYMKSAELMAELRAGAPAALMLASMIQRDEHGNKRIPVLLEQLKLRITDSKPIVEESNDTERHLNFQIELEYGSGENRMKWTIHRSLRDFANLHLRYKLQTGSDKYIQLRSDVDSRPKQPRFPKSAFPYFRGVRGLGESDEDEPDNVHAEDTVGEATHSEADRRKKRRRPSLTAAKSSSILGHNFSTVASGVGQASQQTRVYKEKQRRKLEVYLQEMIRWLIFRADSNRLCRFLELSALGVRLAAEGSYHGKEGNLIIQSVKGLDVRRMLTPSNIFSRHSPKWFLVRHSYLVCVESPESMDIYDVYLVDSQFQMIHKKSKLSRFGGKAILATTETTAKHPKHHRLKLQNSERSIKLLARNERQLRQFESSIKYMLDKTPWVKTNRFGSFAPVRANTHAQWLVDGRDYMWNVSRAINMAKEVIYIHDWWLSPQLYMRRPAAISQKWRLDRLLQKKARQGVKVFIIIYRNVEAAIPIDSEFTKLSLLDLSPNIFVQRSPNQYKKNQFFFAHHEKICVVDHQIAFVGGIDLCFGRWDSPQHPLVDDKPTGFEPSDLPKDADHCQLWPGKDYSNPRVQDFYQLNEPFAEMYDRSKTPRMPWHDISMQVVGQPARDLTRHFVQRWNYILRGRSPTRPTPFLLPPPEYDQSTLEDLGLKGSCEVQILRSASNWSLGVTNTEHSIMTAYCKMIEESEHLVYIENQFFISSCETMNVKITNKIGDAIVERAIRAYNQNESWRCIILIPLMPGFQNTVDEAEGTSVRLIMQCQFRSICRGEGSIFGRLRAQGIEPEDFVNFYSLRSWGKIGPNKTLVTEQLYIHAKAIIVDDRIALIGSANINERSMLGGRDSECAAVVRDTDMLWSTMDGKPYLVGRFAHTLRMRLMREHLGLDIDEYADEERTAELDREMEEHEARMDGIYADVDGDAEAGSEGDESVSANRAAKFQNQENMRSFNADVDWEEADIPNTSPGLFQFLTSDSKVTGNAAYAADVDGYGPDHMKAAEKSGAIKGRDTALVDGDQEVLVTDFAPEGRGTLNNPKKRSSRRRNKISQDSYESDGGNPPLPPMPELPRRTTEQLGLGQLSQLPALPLADDTDIGGPTVVFDSAGNPLPKIYNPLTADIIPAMIDKDCMRDPLNDSFFDDVWRRVADNNTSIFRKVFRCNPDSMVTNWHEYTEYVAYAERFAQAQSGAKSTEREQHEAPGASGPPGATLASGAPGILHHLTEKIGPNGQEHPMGSAATWAEEATARNRSRPDTGGRSDGAVETMNEKAALRNANEEPPSSPFQPTGNETFPTLDPHFLDPLEQTREHQSSRSGSVKKTTFSAQPSPVIPHQTDSTNAFNTTTNGSQKKRRRGTTKGSKKGFSASDDILSKDDAAELLKMVQGSLVVFPYDWLVKEELNSNWLYQVDQVAPLQIYN